MTVISGGLAPVIVASHTGSSRLSSVPDFMCHWSTAPVLRPYVLQRALADVGYCISHGQGAMAQLASLQTEERNAASSRIDRVSTLDLCRTINGEDAQVPKAVEACIPIISQVVEVLANRVRNGGRIFYIGAGTSGRLGVLDASEIPPTYSAPGNQFVALIAGGDYALRKAQEGAEDSRSGAAADLEPFNIDPKVDSLIGIATSGRTPYVLGGLEHAKSLGCVTIGLVCVEPSAVGDEGNADYLIAPVTGPEVVTGSTRMKAGTATKLVLNMLSTGTMVKIGKTYGNLMVDLRATNVKLKQRAKNILRFIGGSECTQSDEELEQILEACHGSVKLAAVTIILKVSVSEAEDRLKRNHGVLTRVFEERKPGNDAGQEKHGDPAVLCVDAGGTSCKACIIFPDGTSCQGSAGPCNVSSVGIDAALATISKAVQEALKDYDIETITFARVWIGIAGYDRPSLKPLVDTALSEKFGMPLNQGLTVTCDIDLLPLALLPKKSINNVVVLVAGTGSVAMSYERRNQQFERTGRAGGWGHILGDDGSGYAIGREAIRKTLRSCDVYRIRKTIGAEPAAFTPLSEAILKHFQAQYPKCAPEHLLSTLLVPDPALHGDKSGELVTTRNIADAATVALSMADEDPDATKIVSSNAERLVELVQMLAEAQEINMATSGLVLAGGLMRNIMYKSTVLTSAEKTWGGFGHIELVSEPAMAGAQYLANNINRI